MIGTIFRNDRKIVSILQSGIILQNIFKTYGKQPFIHFNNREVFRNCQKIEVIDKIEDEVLNIKKNLNLLPFYLNAKSYWFNSTDSYPIFDGNIHLIFLHPILTFGKRDGVNIFSDGTIYFSDGENVDEKKLKELTISKKDKDIIRAIINRF